MDAEDVIVLKNSLSFDNKGRVIGFDYGSIRDKLSEKEYIELLSIIVKNPKFEVDNKLEMFFLNLSISKMGKNGRFYQLHTMMSYYILSNIL